MCPIKYRFINVFNIAVLLYVVSTFSTVISTNLGNIIKEDHTSGAGITGWGVFHGVIVIRSLWYLMLDHRLGRIEGKTKSLGKPLKIPIDPKYKLTIPPIE
jgi:hypothetical protein